MAGNMIGLVSGIEEGFEKVGESRRRQKAIEREDKIFGFQEAEQADRQRVRDSNKLFAEEIKVLTESRANGKLPGADDNVIEQPPAPAPTAIAAPGAAPQPAETPRTKDIFKSGGEGLYKNQVLADDAYYEGLYNITSKHLAATGQAEKMFSLKKQITEMREQGYEPLRKAAAAAVAMGHPNAMQLVGQASRLTGTAINIDPLSGKFDKDAQTWKGVRIIGNDGKSEMQDIPVQNLFALVGALDAGKVVEVNFARKDADRKNKIEQQKADADTKKAGAYASSVTDNAETNKSTRTFNNETRARQADRADDESAAKYFGGAFGLKEFEVKPKDEVDAMLPKQQQAYAQMRQEQGQRREIASYAQNIYSLNGRKVSASFIAQAIPLLKKRNAAGQNSDGTAPASGLPFVTINGQKLLVPKE